MLACSSVLQASGSWRKTALVYQVVFTAANPYVLGVGFAAFRDVASFFKNATQDDLGTPNPIAGSTNWVVARGESQSAGFLRDFVNLIPRSQPYTRTHNGRPFPVAPF